MNDSPKSKAGRQLIFALALLAIAVAGYLVTSRFSPQQEPAPVPPQAATSTTPTPGGSAPEQVILEGTYGCLPHRDASGPQTLECALGLTADDGARYALDLRAASGPFPDVPTGSRIRVTGALTRVGAAEAQTQKYDIDGTVAVTVAERL